VIGSAWLHLASFAVMLVAIRAVRRWTWLYALSVLPGTLAHEAMHWLAGWLFGARPVSLSILPRGMPDGELLLGRVLFMRLRWWNAVPVALAPFLLIPLSAGLLWHSAGWLALAWPSAGLKLLAVQCLLATWPSGRDWRHALAGAAVAGALTLAGLYLYNRLGFACGDFRARKPAPADVVLS
jgi:hypothetical protein